MTSRLFLATAITLACLSSAAIAQDQPAPDKPAPVQPPPPAPVAPAVEKKIDPNAQKAVDEMVKTYQSVTALSGKMVFAFERGTDKQSLSTNFAISRPNMARVAAVVPDPKGGTITRNIVTDGKQFFATSTDRPKAYLKDKATTDPTNISRALGMSGGGGTGLFSLLLIDPQAKDKVLGETTSVLEFGADEKLDNVDCTLIKATMRVGDPANPNDLVITFAVGKEDHLLRRVTVSGKSPQGDINMIESYSEVKVNPKLGPGTFLFSPPPGAKAETPAPPPGKP